MKLIKLRCSIIIEVSDDETNDSTETILQALTQALELEYSHELPFGLNSITIDNREDL